MPPLSHHVELALYADDTAIISTPRKPTLFVGYLESYLNNLQMWLSEWKIAINVSKSTAIIFACAGRRFIQPQTSNILRGANPAGLTLDTRLTRSPNIDRFRKRDAQRLGMLDPVLNRKSDISVRTGVLLYKQLIRPMMDYAFTAWRSAARTHVRSLQVLQSKCLRLDTGAPWYVSNRQIHEDLGFPLFADHIRALSESLDSKLADVEPSSTATRQILPLTSVDPVAWRESQGRQGTEAQ